MLTDAELADARALQLATMVDACVITRPGEAVFDPATGKTTITPVTVHNGPCRVGPPQSAGPVVVAGELVTPTTVPVTIPWDTQPQPGDKVTITSRAHDPAIPATLWVQSFAAHTNVTARNLTCTDTQ